MYKGGGGQFWKNIITNANPFIWSWTFHLVNDLVLSEHVHDCVIYNNTNPFWFKKEDNWGPESHIISTLYKNIPYPLFSKFLSYGI